MMDAIEDIVLGYVRDTFLPRTEAAHLEVDDDLFETSALDSVGLITLVAWIEDRFEFRLADEDLLPEHFRSVRTVARLIRSQRSASATAAGRRGGGPANEETPG